MKTYRYQGTMPSCLPLTTGDVTLSPGATVELPEDVDVVATLEAKGLLVEEDNIPLNPPSKGDFEAGETPTAPEAGEDAGAPSRKNKKSA